MRERSGTHLRLGDDTHVFLWLDEAHSRERMPRLSFLPSCCKEDGCHEAVKTVYCERHYPRLEDCGSGGDDNDEDYEAAKQRTVAAASKFVRINHHSTFMKPINHIKSIVLAFDAVARGWPHLRNDERLVETVRQKFAHIKSSGGDLYDTTFPEFRREFLLRYAFIDPENDGIELPPTVYPLTL